jgi:hypothetical protein
MASGIGWIQRQESAGAYADGFADVAVILTQFQRRFRKYASVSKQEMKA